MKFQYLSSIVKYNSFCFLIDSNYILITMFGWRELSPLASVADFGLEEFKYLRSCRFWSHCLLSLIYFIESEI